MAHLWGVMVQPWHMDPNWVFREEAVSFKSALYQQPDSHHSDKPHSETFTLCSICSILFRLGSNLKYI